MGPLDHRDAEKLDALVREWDRVAPGPIGGDPVRAAGEALCVAVSNLRDELRQAEEVGENRMGKAFS